MRRADPNPTARLLYPYIRKEWKALAAAGASSVVVALAELARPVPLALVVNHLFERAGGAGSFDVTRGDAVLLAAVAALVLAISLFDAAANYVADLQLKRAGERIVHDLRLATHVQLQRLSLAYHSDRQTGDLVTRVTGDVNAVGAIFSQSLGTVVAAVLLLAGMIVVSVVLDPVLALVSFAVVPLLALVTFRARRSLKTASREQRAREGEIASLAAESFAAIREVKAFASEEYEHDRLRRTSAARREAGIETSRIENRFARMIDLVGAVGVAAVLVVGVLRVASGALTPGELIVMLAYSKRTYRPLRDLARQAGQLARSFARAERIGEVLAADQLLEERPDAYRGPPAQGALELDSVRFSYAPDRPVLDGLSLEIAPGERLALTGRSGAGKSTIAALVARFYDPQDGTVRIDGRDLRDCSLEWLRGQIGLVLQDAVLFSGTVAENIAYGLSASREEIEAAAKAAGAHAFIGELPEGYETGLGQRGLGLSGGQRQRLSIARTLLRDPSILVLDEPTTGLDAESEAEVLRGLRRLMEGRTTILITHSSALLALADRTVRIDRGRVADERPEGPPVDALLPADRRPAQRRPALRRIVERIGLAGQGPSARARPVPTDPSLPQAATLLDADAMTPVLHRALGREAPEPDVRLRYLRYKPRTNLVVHYDVGLGDAWYEAVAMIASGGYLARRASKPHNVALARLVDGRSPATNPLVHEPELDALVQWLPLDLSLPALAEPPERLRAAIEANGVALGETDGELVRLAYKPRRRVVLRFGKHVVKHYASTEDYDAAVIGLLRSAQARALETPGFLGSVPALSLTVQTLLPGMRPSDPADVAFQAGELLAALHEERADLLHRTPPAEQLRAAANSAGLVGVIAPLLRPRVERLLGRLEETIPEDVTLVSTHGDFHARQLLVHDDGLSIVDFDAMSVAPAALDVATYSAHVVLGSDGDLDRSDAVLEQLLEGYGHRPEALSWYRSSCILRRSPVPFRYLDEHWPERVERMVAAAEDVLER